MRLYFKRLINLRVDFTSDYRGFRVLFVFSFCRLFDLLNDLHQVQLGDFFRLYGFRLPFNVKQLYMRQPGYCGHSDWGRLCSFRSDLGFDCCSSFA